MPFETYENSHNPHVEVHVSGCRQLRKHGGEHKHGQGGYAAHATYEAARAYAAATGLPVRDCPFCTPAAA